MNKRRESLRVAGWLAVMGGVTSVIAAALTDEVALDFIASYGVLLAVAGLWAVGGVALLNRYQRRATVRQLPVRGIPNPKTS